MKHLFINKHAVTALILLIAFSISSWGNNTLSSIKNPDNDFTSFLKLFNDVRLPFDLKDLQVSHQTIPQDYVDLYIIPYDNEAADAEEVRCVGKFNIEGDYVGVMFQYETFTSGVIIELYVFDTNGNYQSSLILGIFYRSYYQNASLNDTYEIKTEAWFREGDEGENDSEIFIYQINGGKIEKM